MVESKRIEPIVVALNELASHLEALTADTRTLQVISGWNFPALGRDDFVQMVKARAEQLSEIKDSELSPKFKADGYVERINYTKEHVAAHLFDGNGHTAYPVFCSILEYIDVRFRRLINNRDWETLLEAGKIPTEIGRKLRSLNTRTLQQLAKVDDLEAMLETIVEAYTAAENLPTDLESLKEAKDQCSVIRSELDSLKRSAESEENTAKLAASAAARNAESTQKIVEQIEEAYSAATTKGLGQSFQQRANRLAISMWLWVGGLSIALGAGAYIGMLRVEAVQGLVDAAKPVSYIWVQAALAFFSVAAPVWFAWVATKQIGQRFRLAEDYAFKASVARAYEGYRREAIRLDPAFEARLFSSTLDRLEEAPLRFVEDENWGSPLHEALGEKASGAVKSIKSSVTRKPARELASTENGDADEDQGIDEK